MFFDMKLCVKCGVHAAVLATALVASAAYVQDPAAETFSGVSGKAAENQKLVATEHDHQALRSLKVFDYDARACVVEVGAGSLAGGKGISSVGRVKVCEPSSAEAWQTLDVGDGRFITSVQVCTQTQASGTVRLRGVRVQSASVRADGALKPSQAATEIQLAGCKEWNPRRACPKGAVATGLRVNYEGAADGFSALELRCHRLKSTDTGDAGT
ncbi:MAG TPA: hypothetical protein VI072_32910 [Polyangiaceae bacterium]